MKKFSFTFIFKMSLLVYSIYFLFQFIFHFKKICQLEKGNFQLQALKMKIPIDWVFLWVNGSDSNWVRKRNEAMIRSRIFWDSNLIRKRWEDHEELRWALRGLEKNAPFVRFIWIVTDNQIPFWLNYNHPKIRLVNQSDLLGGVETFNSIAIYFSVVNITGLSEHFVLACDDNFVLSPIKETDLFTDEGLSIFRIKLIQFQPENQKPLFCNIKRFDITHNIHIVGSFIAQRMLFKIFRQKNLPGMQHNSFPVILSLFKESLQFVNVSYMKYETVRTCGDIEYDAFLIGYHYLRGFAIINDTNHKEIFNGRGLFSYLNQSKIDSFVCINDWTRFSTKLLHLHLQKKSSFEFFDLDLL